MWCSIITDINLKEKVLIILLVTNFKLSFSDCFYWDRIRTLYTFSNFNVKMQYVRIYCKNCLWNYRSNIKKKPSVCIKLKRIEFEQEGKPLSLMFIFQRLLAWYCTTISVLYNNHSQRFWHAEHLCFHQVVSLYIYTLLTEKVIYVELDELMCSSEIAIFLKIRHLFLSCDLGRRVRTGNQNEYKVNRNLEFHWKSRNLLISVKNKWVWKPWY